MTSRNSADTGARPVVASRRNRRRPNFWAVAGVPAIIFLAIAFVAPLAMIVGKSLESDTPFAFYAAIISEPIYQRQFIRTVLVSLSVTALCLVIGYPYAYAMARGGRHLSTALGGVLLVSFWTSLLVRTFAWGVILNDTGIVNTLLLDLGVIDQPIQLIRNLFGVLVGMVHIQLPMMILAVYAALRTVKPELELAAQSLGARPVVAFWRITVPLSLPGVAAGAVLVFVLSLGFYLTPQLLGGPGDVMISQSIVLEVQRYLEPGMGAALGVVLIVLVLIVLAVASRFVGIKRILGITEGKTE
ncbi:ABC transporter permease [Pseudoclavibacter terrae]|uniref:ABC transporter permease n=1 Tax=Pseudoclavibacter terrae TaxID=1530195 RepID=UPI00232F0ABF|nr:ABC transporter permease [Pseudoclavibacter terrae]